MGSSENTFRLKEKKKKIWRGTERESQRESEGERAGERMRESARGREDERECKRRRWTFDFDRILCFEKNNNEPRFGRT
jgi:hypothetical protein